MTDSSHQDRRTPSTATQASMFDRTETLIPSPPGRTLSPLPTTMKGTRSLARLRDRVDLAVKELDRLRTENKNLRRELKHAASHGPLEVEGTPIVFSESAPDLRARIESCIKAIDDHMAQTQEV